MTKYDYTKFQRVFELAVEEGDVEVVKHALEHGLDIFGGLSGGVNALVQSARRGHVGVMQLLSEAGVRDTGAALMCAIRFYRRNSVMFLLKHYETCSLNYVDGTRTGVSLLFKTIELFRYSFSPKLLHWLVSAGVPTKARVTVVQHPAAGAGREKFTPRELVDFYKDAYTREEAPTLFAIDKLLKQEEAVHAVSWLWPAVDWRWPSKKATPIPVHVVRRSRSSTSRVVLSGLVRYINKS